MKQALCALASALLFCMNAPAQCPESVTYGDPSWPNKITFSDGTAERIFYFKEMVAIAGEGRFWLKSPVFQGNRGEEGDLPGNTVTIRYFADEAEPDYTLSISDFKLESGTIDCFEMPEKFGGSGVRYTRELTPGNYRTDEEGRPIMSAGFEVRSRRDESFAKGELDLVYIVPLQIPEPPEDVVLRTSPDTLRGHITYNTVYNADTRDRPGLTVVLAADTLHRFSLHEFKGKPGVFRFADQLFEIREFDDSRIVLDRYTTDRDRVNEIAAETFFDFNLAAILAEEFPEEERTHVYRLEGPYRLYGGEEAAQPEDLLSGYRYDMHDAANGSGGYAFFEAPRSEKNFLPGKPLMRFDPAYLTALKSTDGGYTFRESTEKDGDGYTLNAEYIPLRGKKKNRAADTRSFSTALHPSGTVKLKALNEGTTFTAELSYTDGGAVHITAENEAQGRQETVWNRHEDIPDIAMMFPLLASVPWEEGLAVEAEFQDFNLLQSMSYSTGGPMGQTAYSKRTVSPVTAEIRAEAETAGEINGRPAHKVALYTKDFGRGNLLLNLMTQKIPGYEPYRAAGYLWFAADSPGILRVEAEGGDVLFEAE